MSFYMREWLRRNFLVVTGNYLKTQAVMNVTVWEFNGALQSQHICLDGLKNLNHVSILDRNKPFWEGFHVCKKVKLS